MNALLHYFGLSVFSLLLLALAFICAIFVDLVDVRSVGTRSIHYLERGLSRTVPRWMVIVVKGVLIMVGVLLVILVCALWMAFG